MRGTSRQFSDARDVRVLREDLFHQRRPRPRHPDDEDRGLRFQPEPANLIEEGWGENGHQAIHEARVLGGIEHVAGRASQFAAEPVRLAVMVEGTVGITGAVEQLGQREVQLEGVH
jgi:hypothetical protein